MPRRRSVDSLMIKRDLKDTRESFYDFKMQVTKSIKGHDELQNKI